MEQICQSLKDICSSSILGNLKEETVSTETGAKPIGGRRRFSKIDKEKIRELVQVVTALGHAFTKLVDILLCDGIKVSTKTGLGGKKKLEKLNLI